MTGLIARRVHPAKRVRDSKGELNPRPCLLGITRERVMLMMLDIIQI